MSTTVNGMDVVTLDDAAIIRLVAEAIRQTRPPWYERAPFSYILGGAGALLVGVGGDGIAHYLGWS
jgi:hypothetical protein